MRAQNKKMSLAIVLLLAACAPTSAQLLAAGQWSATARRACLAEACECAPAQRCSGAVVVLAAEGARRSEFPRAQLACDGIREPPRIARALFAELGAAIGVAAQVAAAHALEREQTRLAVSAQAVGDLRDELARPR